MKITVEYIFGGEGARVHFPALLSNSKFTGRTKYWSLEARRRGEWLLFTDHMSNNDDRIVSMDIFVDSAKK
jgi:hypothetical protein